MNIGMLWFDNNKNKDLPTKVREARDYYIVKYNRIPDLCIVNNSLLEEEFMVDKVKVIGSIRILTSHLWIGVESDQDERVYRKPITEIND